MAAETAYYSESHELENTSLDVSEYLSVLRRRFFQFLIPALIIFALSIMLAFGLPAVYRSSATIVIEEQDVPEDLVKSTITSYAAQQVQVVTQHVMTAENILRISNKYNLYSQGDGRSSMPSSELVEKFRDNVNMDLVSADVIDPRSGRATQATIAFSLSFDSLKPATAQKVTSELVDLYLQENLRTRTVKAAGASEFLLEESEALDKELVFLEQKIAEFKQKNAGSLPELYQFNISAVERAERELADTDSRIQELEKREIELASELAQINPSAPVVLPTGQMVLSDTDRLKALQSEYRKKSATYNRNHPDIIRLENEISSLQRSTSGGESYQDIAQQLAQQREVLEDLKGQYTSDHPKVVTAQRLVETLKIKLQNAQSVDQSGVTVLPDNPAYLILQTKFRTTRSERQSLESRKVELRKKIAEYEALISGSPFVEKQYQALLRDYDVTKTRYQQTKSKQREADVAKNMEMERKGERFTLLEPPALPANPHSPNRVSIILLGALLAGSLGLGLVVALEALDDSIRGEKSLQRFMGAAPMIVIPYIKNSTDVSRSWKRRALGLTFLAVVLVLVTAFLHFFYMPIDVIWFSILRNLGVG